MKAARPGGRIYVIGVLAGRDNVSFIPVFMRNLRLQGIFVGSRAMFESMNRALALHRLKPVIDKVFDFSHSVEAFRHMDSAAHFGKVVIKMDKG